MVRNSKPEFQDEFLAEEKNRRGSFQRSRVDNAMAVSIVLLIGVIVLLVLTYESLNWWAAALFGLLFLASEYFALPFKGNGYISIGLLPVVMAIMISGPIGAAVTVLFGIPVFYFKMADSGYKRALINSCQFVSAAALAGLVFNYTGGKVLDPSLEGAAGQLLPWILAVLVFFLVNTFFITPLIAPSSERVPRYWMTKVSPLVLGYIAYGGIGFLAAILYVRLEFPAIAALFIPLLAIRHVYTRYEAMRQVCDETTLAVMEAVEQSEMIPVGHSTGVSDMAVEIAREMNFDTEDIHRLKQAALLHDIGKLAIDPAVLNKEDFLNEEEFEEIKKHPLIGGEVVSREASFRFVGPVIVHHHEQVDGSGYVDGLPGESIPSGAKILAVADAFDAMQHETPYRKSLSSYEAASEVIKSKGIQFDPEVVDAFILVVKKKGIWTSALRDKISGYEKSVAGKSGAAQDPKEDQPITELMPDTDEKREKLAKENIEKTPADGIKYSDVKGEIEKDIRHWIRSDHGKKKETEE
ncbi:MAG: HD domain-containing protein [Actinobacteria bacterium]|nr:HD domain-containing protein [Actinomycetota bacterium]